MDGGKKTKVRDDFGDLMSIDCRIILKCILKKWSVTTRTGIIGLRIRNSDE
jgi:hypothetical protein